MEEQDNTVAQSQPISAPKRAAREAEEPAAWRPITEAEEAPGTYINVRSVTTYRWLEYKPDGKRQTGRNGRWQMAVGDFGGWQNAPLPEGAEFRPNLPAPTSDSKHSEGGE